MNLCDRCEYSRLISNSQGSTFLLCEYSRLDTSYARYPRLPVLACMAFQEKQGGEGPAVEPLTSQLIDIAHRESTSYPEKYLTEYKLGISYRMNAP
jgi:hypothetical protein